MYKQSIFFTLYICIAAATILLSLQCSTGNKEPQNTSANTEHKWQNLHDSAKYVGMQTCRSCHEDMYQSYMQTGMGQSWGKATLQKSAADFHHNQPIYDKHKDLYYKPFWKDSVLHVTEYRLQGRDTIYSRTQKIDYIVGSGHHTNSHIFSENGYLYQAPFTFYVQKQKWDLPPGYEGGYNSRFNRALGAECLTCHNGYPKFEEKSFNKYYKMPEGIDCERCHGPGSIHVAEKKLGKFVNTKHDTDFTIVNPRKLPFHLQIDVCQRCHLQGNAVLKDGKTFFDHKPGMPLSDVMDVFLPVYENQEQGFMMASHAERLRKSPCFLQTNKHGVESFNCITCHNPHKSVKVTAREYFIAKCMDCHKNPHAETPKILQTKGADCISCHMPKSATVDIPHVTITDHFIRVPDKSKQATTVGMGKFQQLASMTRKNPDNLTRAKAFLYFYEKFDHKPFHLDSAYKYLSNYDALTQPSTYIYYYYLKTDYQAIAGLVQQKPIDTKDAVTNYQVGQAYLNLDNLQKALPWLQKAVNLLPFQLDYRIKLGTTYLQLQQFDNAKKEFDFVIKENPKKADAWNNRGFLNLVQNNIIQAETDLHKSLSLDPDYEPAILNMAKVYLVKGEGAKAKYELNKVLKKDPKNAAALQLKSMLQ